MTGEQLIAQAIKARTEAGFGLRVFGAKAEAEGVVERQYAPSREVLNQWIEAARDRGFECEII